MSPRRSLTIDILRDLMQKALPFLKPLPQRLDEAFISLPALELRCGLRITWQRRRYGQPEADEQRQGLDRDSDIALNPLDLPRQAVEAPGKSGLPPVSAIRRQEGSDCRLHDCRARQVL